jgi:hypothetical protein
MSREIFYCPNGCCQIFETTIDPDDEHYRPECGACGRRMTADPTAYNNSHDRREEEGIAALTGTGRKGRVQ